MPKGRKTLSEFLLENRVVSSSQMQTARLEADKTGEALGMALSRLGMVTENVILKYYIDYCKIPQVEIKEIDPRLINIIPEKTARRYHLIPVKQENSKLTLAMSDPLNIMVLDEIKFRTGLEIEINVASDSEISKAINQFYQAGGVGAVGDIVKTIDVGSLAVGEEEVELKKLRSLAEEAPIIKLVDTFIKQAYHDRASDLHIEPDENILRVRHRIDGTLYDVATLPKYLQAAVISRAKIMADLNIADKRAPQDGRFQINIEGNPIDVRVSSFPTIYGENMVMRLLDVHSILIGLEEIGFTQADLERFKSLIQSPYGIILVTGPTVRGKTTTLYSALNMLNSPKKNIMTVEDPVEYHLFGIRQAQVNPKGGLTFATGLRSILRQDPDIIMVGEVRDLETAEIAVHAALTGHLVLSTLHTNDASSALTRLVDMGVEPFLISSSVIGIIAQRLVRVICPQCKEAVKPSANIMKDFPSIKEGAKLYHGKGCNACKGIGFKGRTGIYEMLVMNEKIKELVVSKASASDVKKAAEAGGMKNIRNNGLEKALAGITTIEEIMQATMIE
ncbi:MAG: type II secretion system ATPase GspE [Candidatus Margulisiibacteriota bacterium]